MYMYIYMDMDMYMYMYVCVYVHDDLLGMFHHLEALNLNRGGKALPHITLNLLFWISFLAFQLGRLVMDL